MRVTAVDEHPLAGGVRGAIRQQEDGGVGHFLRGRETFAERDLAGDGDQLFFRIVEAGNPSFIQRRHHFGGDQRVDAHAVVGQRRGPFARERELCAFRCAIAAGIALAGDGGLGRDIDDDDIF